MFKFKNSFIFLFIFLLTSCFSSSGDVYPPLENTSLSDFGTRVFVQGEVVAIVKQDLKYNNLPYLNKHDIILNCQIKNTPIYSQYIQAKRKFLYGNIINTTDNPEYLPALVVLRGSKKQFSHGKHIRANGVFTDICQPSEKLPYIFFILDDVFIH